MPLTPAERARDAGARARDLVARRGCVPPAANPAAGGLLARAVRDEPMDEGACRKILADLAASGLLRHVVPAAFGGAHGLVEAGSLVAIREELAYGSGLLDLLFVMQGLGSFPITFAGDAGQKGRWLPRVATGEAIAAFAVTEPEAGSDVGAIATRARRDGDGYVLDGVKVFISNAPFADVFTVIATIDPAKGRKGLAAFVVERGTKGLTARADIELIAPHPIGTVTFEACPVSSAQRLGGEGDGFTIAMATLDTFRATVGAAAVGFARRALDEALCFAQERVQFGRPIKEFEGIQFKLADMATKLDAARLLVERAADSADRAAAGRITADPSSPEGGESAGSSTGRDSGYPLSPLGEDPSREASMAKLFATEAAQEIVDEALQIHGGRGLVRGNIVERLYREVRALRIYEGTSEIQRTIIGRNLVG